MADFLRLWTLHEPELWAFVHACLPHAAVDEVIIEEPAAEGAEEMSLRHRQTDALSQDLAS